VSPGKQPGGIPMMSQNLRQYRVVIIGAGFSGICAAIKLKILGICDFLVLERAPNLGGVWHYNNYPGAACDVPSSLYSFSFVDDYDWRSTHGSWSEIVDYINFCVDRFDIRSNLQFGVEAKVAQWNDKKSCWVVATDQGEIESRYVISACGLFNKPSVPSIPGLEDFVGSSFHSAKWDQKFSAVGKVIAVVGTGCSTAQIVPAIVDHARKLLVFQRSPCHVMPKEERTYSDEERALYRRYPILRALERTALENGTEAFGQFQFDAVTRGSMNAGVLAGMSVQIGNLAKRQALLPSFPLGGKRPISSDTYLPALDKDNVEIVCEPIEQINARGIITSDGRKHEVDAIIFATGFATSDYLVPLEVVGRQGRSLQALWREGAYAYLGMMVDGFPNFLMIYGPNSNVVGSILQVIELQVGFIVPQIVEAERQNALAEVDHATVVRFNKYLQGRLAQSIYGQNVTTNYFTTKDNKIVTQWCGTPDELAREIAGIDRHSCLVSRQVEARLARHST
jgi:cation diffusion facilitator CzcD-associated flavoprotein CzcO